MITAAADGGERLNRFLARRGVASRRAADGLIAAGRVLVNGAVAPIGARIDIDSDTVQVDGEAIAARPPRSVTLALNKPAGVVTTMADPHGRLTVRDLVPAVTGLAPIGRLDADSRGLLLLSSDGDLVHRVAHPRHGVRKTYRVTARAPVTDAQIDVLRGGVQLDDGPARALEVRRFDARTVDVVMGEGRKRVVRRLVAAAGNGVADLCRIAVGPIALGDLAEGDSRVLADSEVDSLRRAAGRSTASR